MHIVDYPNLDYPNRVQPKVLDYPNSINVSVNAIV